MDKVKNAVIACSFILLSACGGGGGGGSSSAPAPTPTATNIPFQLFPTGILTTGYTQTYQLTGTDNQGGTYTATFTNATQAQSTYDGQPAIPVQQVLVITNTKTNASVTSTADVYLTTSIANLMLLGSTDSAGYIFTPVSMTVIPQTGMIGQQGAIGTYSGSGSAAGYTDTESWQLTNANNGLANLVLYDSVYSGPNFIVSTKSTYVIDQQGNRQSLTEVLNYANGLVMTFSGS